ncbi:MAG: nitrate reductase cytochrome c-type subunit [Rhodocyclales bacterium]|nr:nitrate reductase cytochrome c-type subunit [Rhodocyclales bacterium]
MRARALAWMILGAALSTAQAQEPPAVRSERGQTPIDMERDIPDIFRYQRDRPPVPRQWPKQPPLIPHAVKGYNITKNFNHCLDCHSPSRRKETGATKVSDSHYLNREGRKTINVSTRRYFCMQCHVPQAEAKPLVENTFRPLKAVTK